MWGLCFVPVLGYGEDKTNGLQKLLDLHREILESKVSYVDLRLLEAKVNYMMSNPNHFLSVNLHYDRDGAIGKIGKEFFPAGTDTKYKIFVYVRDTREQFSDKPEADLLVLFEAHLRVIYSQLVTVAYPMDTEIIAEFRSEEDIPLAYFYQGEYHLWRE